MKPFVGLPTVDAGCAFAPDIDHPACGMPPAVHVLIDAPGWEVVALAACNAHADIARASGEWLREHPYGTPCRDGGCWDGPS